MPNYVIGSAVHATTADNTPTVDPHSQSELGTSPVSPASSDPIAGPGRQYVRRPPAANRRPPILR